MQARCSRAPPSWPPTFSKACSPRTSRGSSRSRPRESTYAEKIGAGRPASSICRTRTQAVRVVRALSPHIGARATLDGRDVIVWRARVDDGRFVPLEVQPAGKRRMTYDEFRRGLR